MARVIPFPLGTAGEAVIRNAPTSQRERTPCIICGSAADWDFHCQCTRCSAPMHEACYYGRVASLEEWRDFLRLFVDVLDRLDADAPTLDWPRRSCPACRAEENT
jgi:hypothetical protein